MVFHFHDCGRKATYRFWNPSATTVDTHMAGWSRFWWPSLSSMVIRATLNSWESIYLLGFLKSSRTNSSPDLTNSGCCEGLVLDAPVFQKRNRRLVPWWFQPPFKKIGQNGSSPQGSGWKYSKYVKPPSRRGSNHGGDWQPREAPPTSC